GTAAPEHPRQCLPRSEGGQDGREARVRSQARLGTEDDARLFRIEIARDEVEQARLLVERPEDALQRLDVGELGLVEKLRRAVDVDAPLVLGAAESQATEFGGRGRKPAG